MVGWHHRLDGNEFEQAPGNSEGQRGLASHGPRGRRRSDTPEPLYTQTWRIGPTPPEKESFQDEADK